MNSNDTQARIAREARGAAARGETLAYACPYPFGTAEAQRFKAAYLEAAGPRAEGAASLPVAAGPAAGNEWANATELAAAMEHAADFPAYPKAPYREAAAALRAMAVRLRETTAAARATTQAEPHCTCPSGGGSLRWPCPAHPPAEPVLFVSPEQLEGHRDHKGESEGGRYLPARKAPGGKFTMPLYAQPAALAAQQTEPGDAVLRRLREQLDSSPRALVAAPASPPAERSAERSAQRSAAQIVQQTEELALLLMRRIYSREPATDALPTMHDSKDPRSQHCWAVACEIQQLLTNTDPEDALSELDEEPAAPAAVAEHSFELWWAEFMPDAAQARAWAAWSAAPKAEAHHAA